MSVLNQIAHFQNRRDEAPNQQLAKDLAAKQDKAGLKEIAENLWNAEPNIQSDCLKVLYEVGAIEPALIADYVADFLKLLKNKQNRLVWGAMTALSTIAPLKAKEIFEQRADVQKAVAEGSVITVDNGISVLAHVSASAPEHAAELFPFLLRHLATCRPKDVPQHSERILVAVNADNKTGFTRTLEKRISDMTGAQVARVRKVLKEAAAR